MERLYKIPEGMELNPDGKHVKKITDKLVANDGYCPCLPVKTADTICPCKYARTMQVCRCGIFVKEGK